MVLGLGLATWTGAMAQGMFHIKGQLKNLKAARVYLIYIRLRGEDLEKKLSEIYKD